ncbi:hypothetical protein GCM10009665_35310 [Kitasatospora nipponensis]|uniref:Beta-ketoacyl synthase-like N-terminal domain-containing protein n=1 Tax=Kitasatospora nipponensis TaxID=258049 RepID=A0ABN1W9J6_9ACTN
MYGCYKALLARSVAAAIRTSVTAVSESMAGTSELGARGGAHTPVSACASGAEAIATGLDLIRLGGRTCIVTGAPRAQRISAALTNSFGFGGHNACLLFTPAP